MSRNPRCFVRQVQKHYTAVGTPPTLLWTTVDARDRIESAQAHGAFDFADVPLPENDIIIGLATPLPTTLGPIGILALSLDAEASLEGLRRRVAATVGRRIDIRDSGKFPRRGGVGLIDLDGYRIGLIYFNLDTWQAQPLSPPNAADVLLADLLDDPRTTVKLDEAQRIANLIRGVWTIYCDPEERDVTGTRTFDDTVASGKGRRHRDFDISVIDVRRPSAPSGGGHRQIEHDHRWSVRGHWRMQPYGPGRQQRRRIWIDPFVCGPEDMPIRNPIRVQKIS